MLQIYNSKAAAESNRVPTKTSGVIDVKIVANKEKSFRMVENEQKMYFSNNIDMLEKQFSKVTSSNIGGTGKLSSSKSGQDNINFKNPIASPNTNVNQILEAAAASNTNLNSQSSRALRKLQQKTQDSAPSIQAEPVNDLLDVMDTSLSSISNEILFKNNAAAEHHLHYFQILEGNGNDKMIDYLNRKNNIIGKTGQISNKNLLVNKKRAQSSQNYRTLIQLPNGGGIPQQTQQTQQSYATLGSSMGTFYGESFLKAKNRKSLQSQGGLKSRKLKRGSNQNNNKNYPERPVSNIADSRTLNLNQQIIKSDISGVFRQNKQHHRVSRQKTKQQLMLHQQKQASGMVRSGTAKLSSQIKVKIQCQKRDESSKNARPNYQSRKNRYENTKAGSDDNAYNPTPAGNSTKQFQIGLITGATATIVNTSATPTTTFQDQQQHMQYQNQSSLFSLKLRDSADIESRIKSGSVNFTESIKNHVQRQEATKSDGASAGVKSEENISEERQKQQSITVKQRTLVASASQNKENDFFAPNAQVGKKAAKQPDFVIKSFVPSIKSKAQKGTRRSNINDAFIKRQSRSNHHLSRSKLNSNVNVSQIEPEIKDQQQQLLKQDTTTQEQLPQQDSVQIEVHAKTDTIISDDKLIEIESPIRIKKGYSVDSTYKKDFTDQRFSTQKKLMTSVTGSDGHDVVDQSSTVQKQLPLPDIDAFANTLPGTIPFIQFGFQPIQTQISVAQKQPQQQTVTDQATELILTQYSKEETIATLEFAKAIVPQPPKPTSSMYVELMPKVPKRQPSVEVLKARAQIFKRNEKVKRNLQDTTLIVQHPELKAESDVGSLQVQNMVLAQRESLRINDKSKAASIENKCQPQQQQLMLDSRTQQQQSSQQLLVQNSAEIGLVRAAARNSNKMLISSHNRLSVSMSHLKKSKQHLKNNSRAAKKRYEASEKFKRDFKDTIKIRATTATLRKGDVSMKGSAEEVRLNKLQNDQLMNTNSVFPFNIVGSVDSSIDQLTQDESIPQFRILDQGKFDATAVQDQYIKSIHSSHFQTSSRQESNLAIEPIKNELIAMSRKMVPQRPVSSANAYVSKKPFGSKGRRSKQNSMAQLGGASATIPIKQVVAKNIYKKQPETQPVTAIVTNETMKSQRHFEEHHQDGSHCECDYEKLKLLLDNYNKKEQNDSDNQQVILSHQHSNDNPVAQNIVNDKEINSQSDNTYKMTDNERQRILKKNNSLVSQFKLKIQNNTPISVMNSVDILSPALETQTQYAVGITGQIRSSVESASTLYNKAIKKNTSTGGANSVNPVLMNQQMFHLFNQQNNSAAMSQIEQQPRLVSNTMMTSPNINDDIKLLLLEKQKSLPESEINSPELISRPKIINRLTEEPKEELLKAAVTKENEAQFQEDFETAQLSKSFVAENDNNFGSQNNFFKRRQSSSVESNRDEQPQGVYKNRKATHNKTAKYVKSKGKKITRITSAHSSKSTTNQHVSSSRGGTRRGSRQFTTKHQVSQFQDAEIQTESPSRNQTRQANSMDEIQNKQGDQLEKSSSILGYEFQTVSALEKSNSNIQVQVETLNDTVLTAEQILSMPDYQIDKLNFKNVCLSQQVLYETLTQLQQILAQSMSMMNQGDTQNLQSNFKSQRGGSQSPVQQSSTTREIKKHIFTTQYQGTQKESMPPRLTPFSVEQQELRRKYVKEQKLIYGTAPKLQQQKYQATQLSVKQNREKSAATISVKLIEEPVESKDRKQVEVDNYYKFKRKQEKENRKQEIIESRRQFLNKCTTQQLIMIKKINFLMQKQNLLVQKAEEIALNEFFIMETKNQEVNVVGGAGLQHKNDSSRLQSEGTIFNPSQIIQQMKSQRDELEQFQIQSQSFVDNRHLPSAQRLSSRRSFHRISQASSLNNSQRLINQAQEQLSSFNRMTSYADPANMLTKGVVNIQQSQSRDRSVYSQTSSQKIALSRETIEAVTQDFSYLTMINDEYQLESQISKKHHQKKSSSNSNPASNRQAKNSGIHTILYNPEKNHNRQLQQQPKYYFENNVSLASTVNIEMKKALSNQRLYTPVDKDMLAHSAAISSDKDILSTMLISAERLQQPSNLLSSQDRGVQGLRKTSNQEQDFILNEDVHGEINITNLESSAKSSLKPNKNERQSLQPTPQGLGIVEIPSVNSVQRVQPKVHETSKLSRVRYQNGYQQKSQETNDNVTFRTVNTHLINSLE